MALGIEFGACSCVCGGFFTIASFDAVDGSLRYVLDHGPATSVNDTGASQAMLIEDDDLWESGLGVVGQSSGTLQKWTGIRTTEAPVRAFYSNKGAFSTESAAGDNTGDEPESAMFKLSDGTRYAGTGTTLGRWDVDTQVNQYTQAFRNFQRMFESSSSPGELDAFHSDSVASVPVVSRFQADLTLVSTHQVRPTYFTLAVHTFAGVRIVPGGSGYIVGFVPTGGAANQASLWSQVDASLALVGWTADLGAIDGSNYHDVTSDGAYLIGGFNYFTGAVSFIRRYTLPLTTSGFGSSPDWGVTLTTPERVLRVIRSSDDNIIAAETESSLSDLRVCRRSITDGSIDWSLTLGSFPLGTPLPVYLRRFGDSILVASNWEALGTNWHAALIDVDGNLTWQGRANASTLSMNDLSVDDDGNAYVAVDRSST